MSENDYEMVSVAGAREITTIMFGTIAASGALIVNAYKDKDGILSPEGISKKIREYSEGNLPTEVQDEPYWTVVNSRHRLVFRLEVPNWYFPCMRDMQQGKLPFVMVSEDPQDDYKRPQILSERNIWPDKPDDKRIKTIYVDYVGGLQTIPFVFDLHAYIWQDPNDLNSFRTPIVIDPGSNGGRVNP